MRSERHLAAILFTDVFGYTAIMAESEERGLAARARHRALVRPLIARYGGECIEARGDESLSCFPAALDAVHCALAILEATRAPDAPRLHIGVHLGDIVQVKNEISGDGVNIAARLCALSDGDAVFASEDVCHVLRNQAGLEIEGLGERELNNVLRPVRVYRIRGTPGAPRRRARSARRARWVALGLLALLLLAAWRERGALLGAALDFMGAGSLPVNPPPPDGVSLAVLPFSSAGAAPGEEIFSRGLTYDLTTRLVEIPRFFVVSNNSAEAWQGADVNVGDAARALGVRYVVRGSVQHGPERARVRVELTDATSGYQVWSSSYDRVLSDLLVVQSEIAEEVLAALNVRVQEAELRRIRRAPTDSLSAYEALQRARAEFFAFRRAGNQRARALCEAALALDPQYTEAYALLANTYNYEYMSGWRQDEALLDRAEDLVQRALAVDRGSPEALATLAALHIARGRWREASASAERSIAIAPSFEMAHFLLGMAQRNLGSPLAALASLRRGLRLDPRGQAPVLASLADLNYRIGRVKEGVGLWERIRSENPDHVASRLMLAEHHDHEGRTADADAALQEVLAINPAFRADRARGPGGLLLSRERMRWLAARLESLRSSAR